MGKGYEQETQVLNNKYKKLCDLSSSQRRVQSSDETAWPLHPAGKRLKLTVPSVGENVELERHRTGGGSMYEPNPLKNNLTLCSKTEEAHPL